MHGDHIYRRFYLVSSAGHGPSRCNKLAHPVIPLLLLLEEGALLVRVRGLWLRCAHLKFDLEGIPWLHALEVRNVMLIIVLLFMKGLLAADKQQRILFK